MKKDEAKPAEKKDETKAAEKKDETKTAEKKEEPLPPIPSDVADKLKAAQKAVAELIVAAQDAGLVKTSIDPPPILDILLTGRATDEASLKARTGVSPEVFGAWFTGYGKTPGVTPQSDVRIIAPGAGLKSWYELRATILTTEIEAVRKVKGPAPKKEEAPAKKDETKKEEPPKKEEAPKADATPKEAPK